MSTHRHIDKICVVVLILSLAITFLFMNGAALGLQTSSRTAAYENRLFDTSRVHTISVVMNDWDGFIEACRNEEYAAATVVIDGDVYKNVGIRAKGNSSLSTVSAMNSDRYSFKIELDHYDSTKSYYGLDKFSLNNLIQDTTYMKDYLTYRLMDSFGVDAPLCSYVYITVNGEDWGLYLAVEGVEESFLQRNYGSDYGELYKPDSLGFGGGRGNGKNFSMGDFINSLAEEPNAENPSGFGVPNSMEDQGFGMPPFGMQADRAQDGFDPSAIFGGQMPQELDMQNIPDRGMAGGMGASDVLLQYIDDDPNSYSSIFDTAKTDITAADQSRLIASLKKLSSGEDIESAVNVDEVIRYFVVHNFVVNSDSYTGIMAHNYYLYEKAGQLSMIPWDYNLAFGTLLFFNSDAGNVVNDPIDTPLSVTGSGDRPMIDWILTNDEYLELYHQYFSEFIASMDFAALINETKALIAPYVEKDPTAFYSYAEFETGVSALHEFCTLRAESVRGQLNGTIAATKEGQSADRSSLIDASQLNLSDMGSMGGMGGGFGVGGRSPGQPGGFPNMGDAQSGDADGTVSSRRDDQPDKEGGFASGNGEISLPVWNPSEDIDRGPVPFPGNGERPETEIPGGFGGAPDSANVRPPFGDPFGGASEGAAQSGVSNIIALSVSVLVLLLGLAFAFKFKR